MSKEPKVKLFPTSTHKSWKRERYTTWSPFVYVNGSASKIKNEVTRISAWEEIQPLVREIEKEAKAQRAVGLLFEVNIVYEFDEVGIYLTARGFRQKTKKELVAGKTAKERNRAKRKEAATKKVEADKAQLRKLAARYPEVLGSLHD